MKLAKAVIPVAGKGVRLFPMTLSVPKPMFPIVSRDQTVVPLLQLQIEEALAAGIEQILLICSPENEPVIRGHFELHGRNRSLKLKAHPKTDMHIKRLELLRSRIDFIRQDEPGGLGDAVLCARKWTDDEWFMMILGDHAFKSGTQDDALFQLISRSQMNGRSILGVFQKTLEDNSLRGFAEVESYPNHSPRQIVSKILFNPSRENAVRILKPADPDMNRYWCILGASIFNPRIFEILERMKSKHILHGNELELWDAIEVQLKVEGLDAVAVEGESVDIGSVDHYWQTFHWYDG